MSSEQAATVVEALKVISKQLDDAIALMRAIYEDMPTGSRP